jgi:hypothetical protein
MGIVGRFLALFLGPKAIPKEVVLDLKSGGQASIAWYKDEKLFRDKLKYFKAWISLAGDKFPKLNVVAMKSSQESGDFPFLFVWIGSDREYEKLRDCKPSEERFKRVLSADVLRNSLVSGRSVSNRNQPGLTVSSTTDFDRLVKDITAGNYGLVEVLAWRK